MNWEIDENYYHLCKDDNGIVIKKKKPIYLPDKTIMHPLIPFRVKAKLDLYFKEDTIKKISSIPQFKELFKDKFNEKSIIVKIASKDEEIVAIRDIEGNIGIYTNTQPFFYIIEGIIDENFYFIKELSEFRSSDLEIKLKRVLEIENFEFAAQIRDELIRRENEEKNNSSLNN